MKTQSVYSASEVKVVVDKNNNINFQLPSSYSQLYFGLKQKYISFGAKAITTNLVLANEMKYILQQDLETNQFNAYELTKYKHPNKQQKLGYQHSQKLSLLEIWDKFCDYIKLTVSESIYKSFYRGTFYNTIKIAPQDVAKQLEIRNFVITTHAPTVAYELLEALKRCYIWAQKENFIPHPLIIKFCDYGKEYRKSADFKNAKRKKPALVKNCLYNPQKIAWNKEEMELIIAAFYSRQRRRNSQSLDFIAYAIEFLFRTGLRTSELSALKWSDISSDFSYIQVHDTYLTKLKKNKGSTKTGRIRQVPCSPKVKKILQILLSTKINDDDYIFKNSHNKQLTSMNISNAWLGNSQTEGVVTKLVKNGTLPQYIEAYSTRRTFISNQIRKNKNDVKTVADWVGDNAETILKHYCYRDESAVPFD